ncbi:hypothetical protein ACFSB1_12410 [Halopseudomonas phragmitis]|uniref:Uncharacterized protein n=1 Tax=Halopseudomonas phragmitis TaxID=1931241 RepID=A0A1V0B0N7_9GAMM|nr:hypothetical protein [Halopseudomonas phragmitis]AQZ93451.1 hypothetical protein BVH74_01135 [Halopseudomonas phragmitis]
MLKYYKRHIFALKDMLDAIDPSSEDFSPLLEIQKYILERILGTEVRINKKKAELGGLKKSLRSNKNGKERSIEIKSKISSVKKSLSGYKFLLYVWRCFGDGIVFKYVSKWNLKRLIFEVDSPEIKKTSGYIGGKEGIEKEWQLVMSATEHNVPAILCDITNSIRHGDICLLGASDPHVIEVKSSSNTNKRVKRQIESIDKIHSYFESDVGSIGGLDSMKRVAFPEEEKHHNSAINEVIRSLFDDKFCRVCPEPGLHYVGIQTGVVTDYDNLFNGIEEPLVYMLNQAKTDGRWDNYYPFTLSIKDAASLYRFLAGEVYLFVVVDGSILKSMFKSIGYDLDIVMSEDAGFIFSKMIDGYEEPFFYIASEHYVGRLGLEFISLKWFLDNEEFMLKEIEGELLEQLQNA